MRDALIALAAVTAALTAGAAVVIWCLLAARSVLSRIGDRRG